MLDAKHKTINLTKRLKPQHRKVLPVLYKEKLSNLKEEHVGRMRTNPTLNRPYGQTRYRNNQTLHVINPSP